MAISIAPFEVGDIVRIKTTDAALHLEPGFTSRILSWLDHDSRVKVVSGPVLAEHAEWYRVQYHMRVTPDGYEDAFGYVCATFLDIVDQEPNPVQPEPRWMRVNYIHGATLYRSAGRDAGTVGILPWDTVVTILGEDDDADMYQVWDDAGNEGWSRRVNFVPLDETPAPETGTATHNDLNEVLLTSVRQLQALIDRQETELAQLREESHLAENRILLLTTENDMWRSQMREVGAQLEQLQAQKDNQDNDDDLNIAELLRQCRDGEVSVYQLVSDLRYLKGVCENLLGVARVADQMPRAKGREYVLPAIEHYIGKAEKPAPQENPDPWSDDEDDDRGFPSFPDD